MVSVDRLEEDSITEDIRYQWLQNNPLLGIGLCVSDSARTLCVDKHTRPIYSGWCSNKCLIDNSLFENLLMLSRRSMSSTIFPTRNFFSCLDIFMTDVCCVAAIYVCAYIENGQTEKCTSIPRLSKALSLVLKPNTRSHVLRKCKAYSYIWNPTRSASNIRGNRYAGPKTKTTCAFGTGRDDENNTSNTNHGPDNFSDRTKLKVMNPKDEICFINSR